MKAGGKGDLPSPSLLAMVEQEGGNQLEGWEGGGNKRLKVRRGFNAGGEETGCEQVAV